jgi:hypothetical protein
VVEYFCILCGQILEDTGEGMYSFREDQSIPLKNGNLIISMAYYSVCPRCIYQMRSYMSPVEKSTLRWHRPEE